MTSKTILQKLRRNRQMGQAEKEGGLWWVNPNNHPRPTLPGQEYLEGDYLNQLEGSCPASLPEARQLVSFLGKERRG